MKIFFFLVLLVSVVIALKLGTSTKSSTTTLTINGIEIKAQLAKTQSQIQKGLGGQNKLLEKEGMLFVMPSYNRYSFWMKDMKFPLDIIWLDKDRIADITKNIPVENNNHLTIYQPTTPVNLVLEVNAGFSDKYKIKVGDKVKSP